MKRDRVRTRLSTSFASRETCNKFWVQAVWDPPPGLVYRRQCQHTRGDHGLKGSLVSDGSLKKSEMREMAETWVQVEDDPNIIDSEVD